MTATMIPVTCCICGYTKIPATAISLISEPSSLQAATLLALNVQVIGPGPRLHCRCGLTRFHVGAGVLACRNCDAPTPGLPPADRSCGR